MLQRDANPLQPRWISSDISFHSVEPATSIHFCERFMPSSWARVARIAWHTRVASAWP